MTSVRRFLLAFFFLASPVVVTGEGPVNVTNPPQGRFLDEWAEVYMGGGKVGYAHSTIAREGNLIRTRSTTNLKIGRLDKAIEVRTVEATAETVAGVPLSFEFEMTAAIMKTETKGTISDGRVTVVSSQYGMEQTQTFDFPAEALMAWGSFRESLIRGFTPGTEYTLQIYAPELRLDGPLSAVTKVGGWEEFDHRGKRIRGQKVAFIVQSPVGSLEIGSFVDEHGRPLKAKVPTPGLGDMEIITTDQATALADFIPPEMFTTWAIKVNKKLDPESLNRVKYRIYTKSPDVDLAGLPTTGMQTVTNRTARSVEVVVTRQSYQPIEPRASARADKPEPIVLAPEELADYLGPNLMINTADPKLIELAERAAGGETEPYALADKLRRFVAGYVKTKSLNIGFATASEVCRTREGDCSEHGVLLAAVGRLNGLPSQVVVGVAYAPSLGGRSDVFAYHMWTQFLIEGRWIDFDAALDESDCSPTRIAFATSPLKNTGLADLSLPLLLKIGAIDIDILEAEQNPVGQR